MRCEAAATEPEKWLNYKLSTAAATRGGQQQQQNQNLGHIVKSAWSQLKPHRIKKKNKIYENMKNYAARGTQHSMSERVRGRWVAAGGRRRRGGGCCCLGHKSSIDRRRLLHNSSSAAYPSPMPQAAPQPSIPQPSPACTLITQKAAPLPCCPAARLPAHRCCLSIYTCELRF